MSSEVATPSLHSRSSLVIIYAAVFPLRALGYHCSVLKCQLNPHHFHTSPIKELAPEARYL